MPGRHPHRHIALMSPPDPGRRSSPAVDALFGVLLAGTLLYFVPTLALNGSILTAAVAALVWVGGLAVLWLLYRRELRASEAASRREGTLADLRGRLLEESREAQMVVGLRGELLFTGPNLGQVVGADLDGLVENGGLLDLVPPGDRRRVLQEFAKVRRQPGASVRLEVTIARPEGGETRLDVRARNLSDDPVVGGVLVTLRGFTPERTLEGEIQHLAYYDALTGLANRRFFFERGAATLSLSRRQERLAAVLYLDLDHFKEVNDLLGHEAGDALLKDVAGLLRRVLRETDLVGRMGGDEFAILLADVRDEDAAGRVAHRILDGLPERAVAEGHDVPVTASIGVALFPEDGAELADLLKCADLAMYRAKTGGLGIQFYRPELRDRVEVELRMEQDMRWGLEHHEFQLHFQPVFRIATGERVGAEALSRWRHFTRGLVNASQFIRLAERSGLVRALDRWAIASAAEQRRGEGAGHLPGWVAVNLSPHSLADPGLPEFIRRTIEDAGLEPGTLVLELPDGAFGPDPGEAADLVWALKNTGAAIALDDYGTWATSLAQLRRLPIDILKLHQDFIRGIGTDAADERVVEATIALAHGLDAAVVAKGVESETQLQWLQRAGCDFIQGHLTGRPVPADQLPSGPDRLSVGKRAGS